ncbi:bifunctional phosphoribosylaminoimidazolecarboxamide formyltransferase/IMP cyclohydrolase [Virgibacillus sp. 179-BFC.A HS]|uniref:Bifunctional purine biosynthesis protein PurH n=1 Tax=Tigheibacillus jepli TaxID=3035914 RepID=A0ABU5CME9_9BACI|nr:bifunctional phosphoribosylaminoimidazolecarboxamide formyltransferase/IMP cyclohydrolase [Virgibacillus sp. 179-BFC.A HS]MDY0406630.1 bifunctional phosphoribosylaminoimidazolecarboxamide formyltransferase/IMP cyclohydrolase [Virgibacillus sp. 179-BFC.A HS]
MKKRALISVSDKTGVVGFAKGLAKQGYEIVSTGGTLAALHDAGVDAVGVEDITGFPEILDGRVKTLHPLIHGGILHKRKNPSHQKQMAENHIASIDMVVVNLYPFKETVTKADATKEEIIENIDIGGPSMLRAAAKNYQDVLVVVDPNDYDHVLQKLASNEADVAFRENLAAKVFRHTAKYDALIAHYFAEQTNHAYPEDLTVTFEKAQDLRYGENPHQTAAFYKTPWAVPMSLAQAVQWHGKELSYNNIQDANACLEILAEYEEPTAVAVKHMNPCGIGTGANIEAAFDKAYDADPVSIFGGIVSVNREITASLAEKLSKIFLEIVIAPAYDENAKEILTRKKNIRLLTLAMAQKQPATFKMTSVKGGILVQSSDSGELQAENFTYPTKRKPTEAELQDLLFAQKACKHVKSNAIVVAKGSQTLGVGAGQMNRVGSAIIALNQAGDKAEGAAMASDAFFPMPDTVEEAAKAGITAIIQPGGSKRDQDSIDVCDAHGIAMVYTGMRHFKH